MKLREMRTIWGIPITTIKEHAKIYKRWITVMYLFDIVVLSLITLYLFNKSMGFFWYIGAIVVFTLLCNLVITNVSHASKYEAFKFYRTCKNCDVYEKQYNISNEQLYSVLYCAGYKRLKTGKTSSEYVDALCLLCCEDRSNSGRIMKYLNKYKDDEKFTLKCLVLKKGRREYLVDFIFVSDDMNDVEED